MIIVKKYHKENKILHKVLWRIVMKKMFKYAKRLVLGGFLLYAYNLIAVTFNITIPINLFTIFFVGIFDVVGLTTLVLVKLFGL